MVIIVLAIRPPSIWTQCKWYSINTKVVHNYDTQTYSLAQPVTLTMECWCEWLTWKSDFADTSTQIIASFTLVCAKVLRLQWRELQSPNISRLRYHLSRCNIHHHHHHHKRHFKTTIIVLTSLVWWLVLLLLQPPSYRTVIGPPCILYSMYFVQMTFYKHGGCE